MTRIRPRICLKVPCIQIWAKKSKRKCPKWPIVNCHALCYIGGLSVNLNHLKSQTGYKEPQADQLRRWSYQGLPRSIRRNWEIPRYLLHLSEGGCHTCCAHTLEMPNSHTTLGRQEAGQALGSKKSLCQWQTNGLGIIISLLMESRRWPKDMPKPHTSEQSYQKGPLQDTNTWRNHPWGSW